MVLTMAAVAAAKGMPALGFSVEVRMQTAPDGRGGAVFENTIHLPSGYSPREQRILYNSARTCEVHHLLRGPLCFREELRVGDGEDAGISP
ncbi:MAG: OsmC family protein [Anaerolineae bacterium]